MLPSMDKKLSKIIRKKSQHEVNQASDWKKGIVIDLITILKTIFFSDVLQPVLSYSGLLIFRAVVVSWNSGKSVESCEIHEDTQNTAKFSRNLIKYMSVQHFWNLSQLLGLFILYLT